jgi:hypothetical protein
MLLATPPAGPAPTAPTEAAAVGRTGAVESSVVVSDVMDANMEEFIDCVEEEEGGKDVLVPAAEVWKVVCCAVFACWVEEGWEASVVCSVWAEEDCWGWLLLLLEPLPPRSTDMDMPASGALRPLVPWKEDMSKGEPLLGRPEIEPVVCW